MIDPENLKKMSKDEVIECCSNIANWGFNDYEEWEQQSAVYGLLDLYKKQQKEIEDYTKFKKDILNKITIWDKEELPDNEIIISVLDTFVTEVSRLEDIEDRKIQVEVKFIEEKRDKYWKDKIREKIKELEDEKRKCRLTIMKEKCENKILVLKELLEEE